MKFGKFDDLPDGSKRYRKTAVIEAVQIFTEFEVDTLEANNQRGKAGDFLVKGISGELYPCDKDIFFNSYMEVEADE